MTAIDTLIAALDELRSDTDLHRENNAIDYKTDQIISQQMSSLLGSRIQLLEERERLTDIIAVWDAAVTE